MTDQPSKTGRPAKAAQTSNTAQTTKADRPTETYQTPEIDQPARAGELSNFSIPSAVAGKMAGGELVPAVAQDWETGEVLMLAYMNQEALSRTLETGKAHYWSRSRQRLWLKGEASGHTQTVREIRVDCDGDAILLKIEQVGGACHTGYRSCFYRTIDGRVVGEKVFDPDAVY